MGQFKRKIGKKVEIRVSETTFWEIFDKGRTVLDIFVY